MLDLKIARLSQKDIEAIRAFEKTLSCKVCLVAVEAEEALYVLEAKLGPNDWRRIDHVYPEFEGGRVYFTDLESARACKAALKTFLIGKRATGLVKRPIRIRLSVPMADEEE